MRFFESEIQSYLHILTGAGVATQVDLFANSKFLLGNIYGKFDSTVQSCHFVELALNSVMVGAIDDVAKCCCKGSIELDFRLVFLSAYSVQLFVNEALHRVDIYDLSDYLVVGVAQNIGCKWLVQVIVKFSQFEQDVPISFI